MRITDLYDLENKEEIRKMVAQSILHDIINLAKERFGDDRFSKFMIQIRLEKIKSDKFYR